VRARLRGDLPDEKGPPMLFFTMACEDAIRTLAALQHDDVESKFEDAETEGEDHPPDGIRYGCMSRPRKLPDPEDRFAAPTEEREHGMADDRGLEGPEDPRLVEAPSGLTPLELRAGEEARRQMIEHLGKRPVLNMDQLAEMLDVRPRLEKEMRLPGDSRGARNRIYFFSIDGTLRGNRLTGCLFAGECIMVQTERGFAHALKVAKDGLHDSVEIAKQYFDELSRSIVVASPVDASHMNVDVGGRRAGASCPGSRTSRATRS
jgi:hypothetical protein